MDAGENRHASATANAQQSPCYICRKIDFNKITDPWKDGKRKGIDEVLTKIPLEATDEESRDCPFCQVFRGVYKDFRGEESEEVCIKFLSGKNRRYHRFVTVEKYPAEPRKRRGSLFYRDDEAPDDLFAEVTPFISSYKSLKRWVDRCHTSHPNCQDEFDRNARPLDCELRLIDCISRKVVEAPSEAEYFALSYVWGSSAPSLADLACGPDELINNPPLTIRDAIRATLELGVRYLWIDRYCVKEGESAAIHSMDQIYRGARATLVAAYGEDDDDGLPGVSTIARYRLPSVKIPGGLLIPKIPPLEDILLPSYWNSRGWTYQEALLSRCCLFFTERGVYFACLSDGRSEHGPNLLKSRLRVPQTMSMAVKIRLLKPETFGGSYMKDQLNRSRLQILNDHVFSYTDRNLTYDKDALNAFEGILRATETCSLWGVPVIHQLPSLSSGTDESSVPTLDLAWCVLRHPRLWGNETIYPRAESRRRPQFPTWSWASTTGRICLTAGISWPIVPLDKSLRKLHFSLSLVQDGTAVPLSDAAAKVLTPNFERGGFRDLLLEGSLIKMELHQSEYEEVVLALTSRLQNGDRLEWDYYPDIFVTDQQHADNTDVVYGLMLESGKDYSSPLVMVVKWVKPGRAERIGIAVSPDHGMDKLELASQAVDGGPQLWTEVHGRQQFTLQ